MKKHCAFSADNYLNIGLDMSESSFILTVFFSLSEWFDHPCVEKKFTYYDLPNQAFWLQCRTDEQLAVHQLLNV